MHTLYQPIQRRHFLILVKSDHIPPLPTLSVFAEEPFLHDHVGVQPEVSSALEQPVLSAICVELVVVAITLSRTSAEMSGGVGEVEGPLRYQSFRFHQAHRL